jgi:glutamate racemase
MIGIYDSGLGGLSILRAVQHVLPTHDVCYLADNAFFPYGPRSIAEVCSRAHRCTDWLAEQGAGLVVIACNTATSAAIEMLRHDFALPIVGMEPGVKPASQASSTRRIAVLATSGTLTGMRFARLIQRFASDVRVQAVACPDLVQQVEAGELDSPRTCDMIGRYLCPLHTSRVDTVVLGCTHFHFLAPQIRRLAGPHMTLIDTTPAVARRVQHVAHEAQLAPGSGSLCFATTGQPAHIMPVAARVWGQAVLFYHASI